MTVGSSVAHGGRVPARWAPAADPEGDIDARRRGCAVLALNGAATAFGTVVGIIYLVFIIYCAVVTLRKGHVLLFILGFFCGIAWIIGLFSYDKRRDYGGGLNEHYVPPPPTG
jgi:hypothetical protein